MSVKELILLLCDIDADVAVSHRVDEAHARQDQQAGGALVAETLATSPAVMLKQQSAGMLHICHIPSTCARRTVSHCTSDQLAISMAVAVMLQNICNIPNSSAGTSHSWYITPNFWQWFWQQCCRTSATSPLPMPKQVMHGTSDQLATFLAVVLKQQSSCFTPTHTSLFSLCFDSLLCNRLCASLQFNDNLYCIFCND